MILGCVTPLLPRATMPTKYFSLRERARAYEAWVSPQRGRKARKLEAIPGQRENREDTYSRSALVVMRTSRQHINALDLSKLAVIFPMAHFFLASNFLRQQRTYSLCSEGIAM